jgi:type II secretory ATPase GspE/PulE/Tfp pilus assembly ATPase PilB-like protein
MAAIRIGELLISKGLINQRQLEIALIQQKVTGTILGDTLIKLGFISAREFGQTIAEQFGIEFVDLSSYVIAEEALRTVPKGTAQQAGFIPLELDNGTLTIGITNPSNIVAVDAATRITGATPKVCLVDFDSYQDSIEKAYYFIEHPIQQRIESLIATIKEATGPLAGPVISEMTDLLVMDGIRKRSTDIHISPTGEVVHIFYRIDGVLQFGHCVPKAVHAGVSSRIKILASLDIAEQRLPQDGAFSFEFLNKKYEIRVSTVSTIYGENIVLRVLAGSGTIVKIDSLGLTEQNTQKVKRLFQKSYGIILITGPTGSGKTTTLYAALRELDLLERNVITVEDPVEYRLNFVKQTQVNEKAGYDFAHASRSFMRQDPDVMLLGEIRDEETAKIAVRASITGHLVLSTLHTNDAVTAIPRFLDLNVDRSLLSSSLLAVIAQRLARKICRHCAEEYDLSERELAVYRHFGISVSKGHRGKGCTKCGNTGYSGRVAICEILPIDDTIKELIFAGASTIALQQAAVKNGMVPLQKDGIIKAAEGVTTLEEILRVAG